MQPANLRGFQYYGCYASMNTMEETECSTCCTNYITETVATDGYGSGSQGFGYSNYDCGAQVPGERSPNSNYCGTGSYLAATTNPSCCSDPGGSCGEDGDCCGDLQCGSGGLCITCFGNGGSCGTDADCCSGYCNAGKCGNQY